MYKLLLGLILGSLIGGMWVQYRIAGTLRGRPTISEYPSSQEKMIMEMAKEFCRYNGILEETSSYWSCEIGNRINDNGFLHTKYMFYHNKYLD